MVYCEKRKGKVFMIFAEGKESKSAESWDNQRKIPLDFDKGVRLYC